MANETVGVLGSGGVGETLADGFLKHGYTVMRGSRDPGKLSDWQQRAGARASVGTFADAAKFGETIVLAVKGTAAEEVLRLAGPQNFAGKVVIDTTNPIADAPPDHGVVSYFTRWDESLMERLQRQLPEARFVKAFNSVGQSLMVNPELAGGPPTMFICGNDASAKRRVGEILDRFGWDIEDAGEAQGARAIEPLAITWCVPGFLRNDWRHAFKILR